MRRALLVLALAACVPADLEAERSGGKLCIDADHEGVRSSFESCSSNDPCDSGEYCFTDLICGGGAPCNDFGDQRCHRSCDGNFCGAGERCCRVPFFGGDDLAAESRWICLSGEACSSAEVQSGCSP